MEPELLEALADEIALTITAALAPVLARCAALEARPQLTQEAIAAAIVGGIKVAMAPLETRIAKLEAALLARSR